MKARFMLGTVLLSTILVILSCTRGRFGAEAAPPRPGDVLNFTVLYQSNCAGCHGSQGKYGPAMALSDPVYQALVDDETLRTTISKGRTGTAMSAFAQNEGGLLTDQQISSIVRGIRERWSKPSTLSGVELPPYTAKTPGNPQSGQAVFAIFCSSCHGVDGKGGAKAGSIVDWAYLSLVSNQELRTIVITGRPDFGAPDWRNDVPGRPMTDQEISDVVAWLISQRPAQHSKTSSTNMSSLGGPQ